MDLLRKQRKGIDTGEENTAEKHQIEENEINPDNHEKKINSIMEEEIKTSEKTFQNITDNNGQNKESVEEQNLQDTAEGEVS